MYSNNISNSAGYMNSSYPYAYGVGSRQVAMPQSSQMMMPQSSQMGVQQSSDRAGFLFPFLLGGLTGGLVAPYFYPRPYYYNSYPYYGPYYRYY